MVSPSGNASSMWWLGGAHVSSMQKAPGDGKARPSSRLMISKVVYEKKSAPDKVKMMVEVVGCIIFFVF